MLRTVRELAKLSLTSPILSTENVLKQQTRNTFILKRRWPLGLHKKNGKPRQMRAKHFVYDLVEDTNIKKKPNLEVVLTTFVEGYGDKGDIISLKQNAAYTKLLLPGLAVYKTPENIARYMKNEDDKSQVKHSSPFAQRTVNMLESLTLAVVMNKDSPWVLEPWHIRASLRKAGYHAVDEAIELPKEPITGPDLKVQNKEFCVTVTVNNCEKATLKCRIHHWSTDPSERLPYVFEHWKETAEPLFGSSEVAAKNQETDKLL